MSEVKVVVTVPEKDADRLRMAIGESGGGKIGNYSFCSYSIKGTGRFRPESGANPHLGKVGKPESVKEERIEVTCDRKNYRQVIKAIRAVHPYEEPTIDVYSLLPS